MRENSPSIHPDGLGVPRVGTFVPALSLETPTGLDGRTVEGIRKRVALFERRVRRAAQEGPQIDVSDAREALLSFIENAIRRAK